MMADSLSRVYPSRKTGVERLSFVKGGPEEETFMSHQPFDLGKKGRATTAPSSSSLLCRGSIITCPWVSPLTWKALDGACRCTTDMARLVMLIIYLWKRKAGQSPTWWCAAASFRTI